MKDERTEKGRSCSSARDKSEQRSVLLQTLPYLRECSTRLEDGTKRALLSYATHLLGSPDYQCLYTWLDHYGVNHLVPLLVWYFKEISGTMALELGAGTGWFGDAFRRVTAVPVVGVDTRTPAVIQGSIEDPTLLSLLSRAWNHPDIVILASSVLHCINNPLEVLKAFDKCSWVILEPALYFCQNPWYIQLQEFGANPLTSDDLDVMFAAAGFRVEAHRILDHLLYIRRVP